MKKIIKTLTFGIIASLISISLFNCTKKDAIPNQNFLESLLADSLFKAPTSIINGGGFNYGLTFQANTPGKITRVGIRKPKPGTYKVTLWDTDKKSIIFTKTIEQEQAGKKAWIEITPIVLEPNKKYTYTELSDNWYDYRPKNSVIIYPYTKNKIVFLGYGFSNNLITATTVFPTTSANNYIAGDADFTFQPDAVK